MTERQQNGANTQRYRYRATSSVSRPIVRRGELGQRSERVEVPVKRAHRGEATGSRRITMPHEAVQPLSWAERRARFRDPRAVQPAQGRLVQRSLYSTGRPAPVGQVRGNRRLPGRRAGSPVPARSRQRRLSWRFWRRLFGFLVVLAVVVGGVSFALSSSTFHVQQVQISGTRNTGLISAVQHMGLQGQNVFLLNSAALTRRIETLPLVASAALSVQLPNSVTVTIQERAPVLLWRSGRETFGIAQDGVVIAPLDELSGTASLATVVDQRRNANIRPGERFPSADIIFVEQLLQRLPDVQGSVPFTLQYIDSILVAGRSRPANEAGAGGSYVVSGAGGWLAYVGDAGNSNPLENRMLELQQILHITQEQHMHLATIDLRFGLRPTYTLQL